MPGRVLHEVLWSAGRPRGAFSFRAESGVTQASCLSRQPGIPAWAGDEQAGKPALPVRLEASVTSVTELRDHDMRVLHLNTHASGGSYEYAALLSTALVEQGIESRVLCKNSPPPQTGQGLVRSCYSPGVCFLFN